MQSVSNSIEYGLSYGNESPAYTLGTEVPPWYNYRNPKRKKTAEAKTKSRKEKVRRLRLIYEG